MSAKVLKLVKPSPTDRMKFGDALYELDKAIQTTWGLVAIFHMLANEHKDDQNIFGMGQIVRDHRDRLEAISKMLESL